jgi:hypothetical protein
MLDRDRKYEKGEAQLHETAKGSMREQRLPSTQAWLHSTGNDRGRLKGHQQLLENEIY